MHLRGGMAGAMAHGLYISIAHVRVVSLAVGNENSTCGALLPRSGDYGRVTSVLEAWCAEFPTPAPAVLWRPARVHHPSIVFSIGDMSECAMTILPGNISTMIRCGGGYERDNNHITMKDLLSLSC